MVTSSPGTPSGTSPRTTQGFSSASASASAIVTAAPAPSRPGQGRQARPLFRTGRLARRAVTSVAVATAALALVAADLPSPAPLGIGDRLFPHLGNPGYDVSAYDTSLRYGGDNSRPLSARTRIAARVTANSLPRLNLDFAGGRVRSVRVNGRPAAHSTAGEDLVITPRRACVPRRARMDRGSAHQPDQAVQGRRGRRLGMYT